MTDEADRVGLPYPPPYQDIETLAAHISLAPRTIEDWVREGRLPAPVQRKGKRLWKWTRVVEYLDGRNEAAATSSAADSTAERIRNATRAAASEAR